MNRIVLVLRYRETEFHQCGRDSCHGRVQGAIGAVGVPSPDFSAHGLEVLMTQVSKEERRRNKASDIQGVAHTDG